MARICRRLLTGGGAALALTLLLASGVPDVNAQQAVPTHGGRSYSVGLTGLATGGGDPDLAAGGGQSLALTDSLESSHVESSTPTSGNGLGSSRTGNPATSIPRRPDGSELLMVLVPTVLAAIAGLAAGAHIARSDRL